jgi:hypothetical protein
MLTVVSPKEGWSVTLSQMTLKKLRDRISDLLDAKRRHLFRRSGLVGRLRAFAALLSGNGCPWAFMGHDKRSRFLYKDSGNNKSIQAGCNPTDQLPTTILIRSTR